MKIEPVLLYKSPGPHFGPNGKTYAYIGANTEEQLANALASGWKASFAEVMGMVPAAPSAPPSAPVEAPKGVSIEELRAQAEKLGIKVDKRWGADKIAELISKT